MSEIDARPTCPERITDARICAIEYLVSEILAMLCATRPDPLGAAEGMRQHVTLMGGQMLDMAAQEPDESVKAAHVQSALHLARLVEDAARSVARTCALAAAHAGREAEGATRN